MAAELTVFAPWLARWGLTQDGEPFATASSRLLPVRQGRLAAFLKLAMHPEEKRGGAVMAWYAGGGAAGVLAHDTDAVLLERLDGPRSLSVMARNGDDEAACRILCETVARLHAPRPQPPPDVLIPLGTWFAALWPRAEQEGGVYALAAEVAHELLADQGAPVVLHGDIHHGNVLDGGARGWRAIDPKGVWGDRGYDYANLLCNPGAETAIRHLDRRLAIAAEMSGLERTRLLRWLVAYLGLSASWTLSDGGDPWQALAILEAARSML
ncbi:MAG: aminoglycoside phosphotransferase family protein [Phenylobacterium sp.]